MVRVDDHTMSLQRKVDVVHITAASGQELPVFDARQGLTDFYTAHWYGAALQFAGKFNKFGAGRRWARPEMPLSGRGDCRPFLDSGRSVKYQLYSKCRE